MSYQSLTQPSSIGRVLDSGFKLFAASLSRVLPLAIIAGAISILMQYSIADIMPAASSEVMTEEELAVMMAGLPVFFGYILIFMVVSVVFYNAMLFRIGNMAASREDGLGGSIVAGLKKLFPVFFAMILYMIAMSLGLVLLVIPGLILMLTLIFSQTLIVVDNEGIFASLKKSHALVWGNYWRTAAVITIPLFILYAIFFVVGIIAGVSGAMEEELQSNFGIIEISMSVIGVFYYPLYYAIFVSQVNDLKLRRSGSDLEDRINN